MYTKVVLRVSVVSVPPSALAGGDLRVRRTRQSHPLPSRYVHDEVDWPRQRRHLEPPSSPLPQDFLTSSNHATSPLRSTTSLATPIMSSPRGLAALSRARPASSILATAARPAFAAQQSAFSTSARRAATTEGPPPQGFRLPKQERWDTRKDSVFDQAGNYFLLTEMLRGMYVVLEQYFRPP